MRLTHFIQNELAKIVGKEAVLTDELSLALYAYDCSLSRTKPDAIIHITKAEQIAPVLQILYKHRIPFVPRASATNHAGSCAALKGGVILNLTSLNKILEINTQELFAIVQPGVVVADLQRELAALGYFYAPDPASERTCTIGGNAAQNASGARGLKYGGTSEHILEACFVLPDGKTQTLTRAQAGPDLLGLLIGSEGTLGIFTELKVKILPLPKQIQTFLVTFPSLQNCVETVTDLLTSTVTPRCVEAMDSTTLQAIESFAKAGYPAASALLILELDGSLAQVKKDTNILKTICQKHDALQVIQAHNEAERAQLWYGRKNAYAAMARLAPNVMVGDATVPRSHLPQALLRVQHLLQQNNTKASLLFHAGDGNFHPHLLFDARNKLQTRQAASMVREILKICVDEQGTISGEHGIGVEKRAVMAYQYDVPTLAAMARIKQLLDPYNLANPLKILPEHLAEKAQKQQPLCTQVQVLQQAMQNFQQTKTPFVIVGQNTLLRTKNKHTLSSKNLQKIIEIDSQNLTVTAQAGITLETLAKALKKEKLYSVLPSTKGSLGGAFCSGRYPIFYAHVLGIEALLPDGNYIRYGGKLMKNASGYCLTRLLAGSQGTLGLVTQLTFKVFAVPVQPLRPQTPGTEPSPLWNCLRKGFDSLNLVALSAQGGSRD